MKDTKVQWCDGTVNPVMGCGGCELWPTIAKILAALATLVADLGRAADLFRGRLATEVYHARKAVARTLSNGNIKQAHKIEAAIAGCFACYSGVLHLRYGADHTQPGKRTNPGYARVFEHPELFPGRMVAAARWSDLRETVRSDKPWLNGLPRTLFISDMGDALSAGIPFDYLHREVIDVVNSSEGQRHLWLWLTKRPARMAQFDAWLAEQGIDWPENLVAMTSVTSQSTVCRVDQLKRVRARFKGLSVEPLFSAVELPLGGIDWCIVGGESGPYAQTFDLAWARRIIAQCRASDTAPFIKQLGRRAVENSRSLTLRDSHGGDWSEWPDDLRVRELPAGFRQPAFVQKKNAGLAKKAVDITPEINTTLI